VVKAPDSHPGDWGSIPAFTGHVGVSLGKALFPSLVLVETQRSPRYNRKSVKTDVKHNTKKIYQLSSIPVFESTFYNLGAYAERRGSFCLTLYQTITIFYRLLQTIEMSFGGKE